MTDSQLLTDLRATREFLTKESWGQKTYYDSNTGCYCVLGAMSRALCPTAFEPFDLGVGSELMQRYERARDALGKVVEPGSNLAGLSIAFWNDAPGRTKEEILATLDRTIAQVEAQ